MGELPKGQLPKSDSSETEVFEQLKGIELGFLYRKPHVAFVPGLALHLARWT